MRGRAWGVHKAPPGVIEVRVHGAEREWVQATCQELEEENSLEENKEELIKSKKYFYLFMYVFIYLHVH